MLSTNRADYPSTDKPNKMHNLLLSEAQIIYLKEHGLSDSKINKIIQYLENHKDGLTDYVDLVGDDLLPGPLFFHNMKHYGHLLNLDPEESFTEKQNLFRAKVALPIIWRFGKFFLGSDQIIENRNELRAYSQLKSDLAIKKINDTVDESVLDYKPDPGIVLPKEPVLWTLNHGFKDDVLASALCVSRPFVNFFGSIPQFYNTFDGVMAYHCGSIIVNRKHKESRKAGQEKIKKAMAMGLDVLMSPEGVWNKNPHKLLEYFWPGVYRIAKETNAKVVPIVHYIYDPTQRIPRKLNPIHTVIDDPIDLAYMPEKEALECFRDVFATWYYIMMEKYGRTTRQNLLKGYKDTASAWEEIMQAMMKTVDRYDREFEKTITYHPKGIVKPEDAFELIAAIEPTKYNVKVQQYAKELVLTRKKEDFQGRF